MAVRGSSTWRCAVRAEHTFGVRHAFAANAVDCIGCTRVVVAVDRRSEVAVDTRLTVDVDAAVVAASATVAADALAAVDKVDGAASASAEESVVVVVAVEVDAVAWASADGADNGWAAARDRHCTGSPSECCRR